MFTAKTLIDATIAGNLEKVKQLLSLPNADVNAPSPSYIDGNTIKVTALVIALAYDNVDVAK